MVISEVISDSAAAESLKYSLRSLCASFQSSIEVWFDIMSPHPAARSLKGAWLIIFVSAMTPIGGFALRDTLPPSFFIEALGDAIPSWEAAVGTLMKCISALVDASFAVSITLPPPTPRTIETSSKAS